MTGLHVNPAKLAGLGNALPHAPHDGVPSIADAIDNAQPATSVPVETAPDLSHDELALRMGEAFGWDERARYVQTWGRWLFWDGARWRQDDKLRHMTECRAWLRQVADDLQRWAETRADTMKAADADALKRWAKKEARALRSEPTRNHVVSMAASNPGLVASADQFDANLDVIGTPGGVVDLRTGQLRPSTRDDYLTRSVAIAPECKTPERWLQFLCDSMDNDLEMVGFLQRLCGYALTGHTSEHKLPFLWGPGGNGKSVFANTLHDLFGDYAKRAPAEAFLQARGERHPTDLAGLAGARLVIGSELPAGRAWNESVIKDLTGGDSITARFMRMDFFTYRPQFSLLIVGNHMPAIGSVDDAMRRRVLLIPFTKTVLPEKRDTGLQAKLREEWPGILQWAISGAVAWYRDGLQVPDKVTAASSDYLDAEDVTGQFMDACMEYDRASGGDLSSDAYAAYTTWMEGQGAHPMSQRAFTQALRERGVTVAKYRDGRRFVGWCVKPGAQPSATATYKPWVRGA